MMLKSLLLAISVFLGVAEAQFETLRFPCSQLVTERLDPWV